MKEIEIKLPKWVTRFCNKNAIREEVKQLAYNLNNFPEDWTVGTQRATMCHDETKIALWVANGWEYLDFWPKKEAFSKKEKKYLREPISKILNKGERCSFATGLRDFAKLMKQINETQGERNNEN